MDFIHYAETFNYSVIKGNATHKTNFFSRMGGGEDMLNSLCFHTILNTNTSNAEGVNNSL